MKKPIKNHISQEDLVKLLSYNKATGEFVWRDSAHWKVRGKKAGRIDARYGYIRIGIVRKVYQAHRLAWLYVYNEYPRQQLDHINGDRTDNRIENLRIANTAQNQQNCKKHKDNTSGFKGVSFRKGLKKPWRAAVQTVNKYYHVGYFSTPEEASDAYLKKAKELFGEFASRG